MSLARFSVNQVVLVNLLFLVFLLGGAVVMSLLPVDVYPDTQLAEAVIDTVWPGASSEEVERLVTKKVEDEIADVKHRERVLSYSLPNLSRIHVKFRDDISDADIMEAFEDLRSRLDQVKDLPEDAEEPLVTRLTLAEAWPMIQIGVVNTGGVDEHIVRGIARDFKDRARELPGILRVQLQGTREPEVWIRLNKDQLEKNNLSLAEVAAILQRQNQNIPAGTMIADNEELTIRSVGEVQHPEELADICIVRSPTGAHVRLGDLGTIETTFEKAVVSSRYDGKPCTIVCISKAENTNSLTLREDTMALLEDYKKTHEIPGVELQLVNDSTTIIESRIGVLKNNLAVGLVCVFVILWMFVGFRNSMLAIIGIPFSFLCAFIFMFAIDVSINVVSVFALVLVSGMIVDDAIVVLENIYRHAQEGKTLREAVIAGTDEVMWPVVSSTMTTIAAFLPLLLMPGVIGKFFAIVPKTVTVALLASLFECLIILPAHYLDWGPRPKLLKSNEKSDELKNGLFGIFGTGLLRVYETILGWALRLRYLGLVLLASLTFLAWEASRTLIVEMFPADFPQFCITFNTPAGTSLEDTDQIAADVLGALDDLMPEDISRYLTLVGTQINEDNQQVIQPNLAQAWVDIADISAGNDPTEIMRKSRNAISAYLATRPDLKIENMQAWPLNDGPPTGKPVSIHIQHPDYEVLRKMADRVGNRLAEIPGVTDVADNLIPGQNELRVRLDEARASELGLTFMDVATAVRGANDGLEVGEYRDTDQDEDMDIKVMYAESFVQSAEDLFDIDIKAPGGRLVKVSQVADIEFDQAWVSRYHWDTKRAVLITADVDTRITDASRVNKAVLAEFGPLAEADPHMRIRAGGQFEETNRSFEGIKRSAFVALALMYLILASQFRSYAQPFIVLSAVIFGAIGMMMGLVIFRYPFSTITAIAMVGLFGVVVNDALVLLDFINTERRKGTPLQEALVVSCRKRVRPIILTTLTTVFGLAPMAIGVGGYSKIWSPFAMSLCWGLSVATVLTLILVPALYHILEDFLGLFHGKRKTPSE